MNGFELAGRQIRVGLGNDKFTPESTATLLRTFNQQAQSSQGSAFSGAGGRGAYAGGSGGVFDRTHSKDDRGVSGASALDDTDVAGVNFKTYDRSKLMDALARRDPAETTKQGAAPVVSKPRAPVVDKPWLRSASRLRTHLMLMSKHLWLFCSGACRLTSRQGAKKLG